MLILFYKDKEKIELELKMKRIEKFNSLESVKEYRKKYETSISAITYKRDQKDKLMQEENKLMRHKVQDK